MQVWSSPKTMRTISDMFIMDFRPTFLRLLSPQNYNALLRLAF
jgi:hypothetical protein